MLNFGKRRRKVSSESKRLRQNAYPSPSNAENSTEEPLSLPKRSQRSARRTQLSVKPVPAQAPSAVASRSSERQLSVLADAKSAPPRERSRARLAQSAIPKEPRQRPLAAVPSLGKRSRKANPYLAVGVATASSKPARSLGPSGLALLYGTRLLILGIGIGVLAGTMLSVWDPANRVTADTSQTPKPEQVASPQPIVPALELAQEMTPLKGEIERIASQLTDLSTGVMVVDLDTQAYLDINASTAFSAASTIKFPLLVAFFQDVDAGKIRLDEMLTMRKDLIATEAGDLQFQPPGSQFTALEVATKMMTISDNTATNMILDRLGGKDALNQRFQSWGLTNTAIQELLPDLKGTNTSSPKDMATLLGMINKGQMLSMRSLDRMLEMMRNVQNTSMLPQGLGEGAMLAHKTGDIGSMVGDVGIVDMPNGKRYLITAMVKRPHNDDRAVTLVQQISKTTYQYFSRNSGVAPNHSDVAPNHSDVAPNHSDVAPNPTSPSATPVPESSEPTNPEGTIAPAAPEPSPGNSQGAAPLTRTKIAQP